MPGSWSRLCERFEEGLLVALMAGMVLVSFAQIALRNLFSYTLPWAEALVQVLLLWATFVGASTATRQSKHLRIDVFLHTLPPTPRRAMQAGAHAISALVCCLLTWVAVRFVLGEYRSGSVGVFGVSVWKLLLVLPLAMAAMALRFAGQAYAAAQGFFARDRP